MIEAALAKTTRPGGGSSVPPLRIDSMQIFCDVVRYRSFSRSAEDHRMSQPGVSWLIRQMENRVGVSLIDRTRRPWRLTPEGRVFFHGCCELVARYQRLAESVQRTSARPETRLRIAAIYSVGPGLLKQCVRRFAERMPGADVRLEFLHPDRVVGSVLEEKADIGIVSYPRPQAGLEVVPWREEPMVVACPPGHRFAGARAVPTPDLQDEPFVAFDRGLEIRRRIDRYLGRNGVAVRIAMEFDNVEAIKRAVEAGAGIAILPQPALEQERKRRSLEAVPLAGPGLVRPLGILHRRASRRLPGLLSFITLLLDEAAEGASGGG